MLRKIQKCTLSEKIISILKVKPHYLEMAAKIYCKRNLKTENKIHMTGLHSLTRWILSNLLKSWRTNFVLLQRKFCRGNSFPNKVCSSFLQYLEAKYINVTLHNLFYSSITSSLLVTLNSNC